jgi:hypothetical protein
MSKRLPPAAFLDDPVALAPLRKADGPRLERLAGSKEVRVLRETMERLRQETGHGNRLLEAHHVLGLHLLGFYNPMMRSLRNFELASQNHRVGKVVGLDHVCRSTHSDFLAAPRKFLALPLKSGAAIRADIEVNYSGYTDRGLQVLSRNYLFSPQNSVTTTIDDVPTEARLNPQWWGQATVK